MADNTSVPHFFSGDSDLAQYLKQVHAFPLLENEEEYELAKDWAKNKNHGAREKLINSHLRLVTKIAAGYRGYGLPYGDLIAEGNIGLLMATKKYDPDMGNRFSTYARWWIQASLQEYILRSWSMVRIGTTAAQKKLFFNLNRLKHQLGAHLKKDLSAEDEASIAESLHVSRTEVREMNQRMRGGELSLNQSVSQEDGAAEWMDWLEDPNALQEEDALEKHDDTKRKKLLKKALDALSPRERTILQGRRLEEPPKTLEDLSVILHLSKERVRQIENVAFEKLQTFLKNVAASAETAKSAGARA